MATTEQEEVIELTEEEAEFIRKRDLIAEQLKDDETFRKCIAELYLFMQQFDQMARSIAQMGGPGAMLKMVFGGKK